MNPAYFAHLWLDNVVLFVRYINENMLMYYGFTMGLLCMLGLSIFARPRLTTEGLPHTDIHIDLTATDNDLMSIAGEDVIATQLDLAKAYIEMNQKSLAKPILDRILKSGNPQQQQEARQLIDIL